MGGWKIGKVGMLLHFTFSVLNFTFIKKASPKPNETFQERTLFEIREDMRMGRDAPLRIFYSPTLNPPIFQVW